MLVCENHPDKAWPDECDCGAGMHAGKELAALRRRRKWMIGALLVVIAVELVVLYA